MISESKGPACKSLSRRQLLLAAGTMPLAAAALRLPASTQDMWLRYRSRHVTPDGRVVDGANGGISHSEGQGFGLLFAATFDDPETFGQIWRWTASRLRVRDDRLFAWKWDPATPSRPVPDSNNATDGDLLIAWALARGAERWNDPMLRAEAAGLAEEIISRLVRVQGNLTCLLPGLKGFERKEGLVLNPSYWVFPAFDALAPLASGPVWRDLTRTGLRLVEHGFGVWRLPPDWLLADPAGNLRFASGFQPVFGFNAVRVPLYLTWAGLDTTARLAPFQNYWRQSPAPAWIDLQNGATAPYAMSAGVEAIAELTRTAAGEKPATLDRLPGLTQGLDYYAASLLMMARIAFAERFPA